MFFAGITGAAAADGDAVSYTIRYVDQNGDPVAGVTCQVCDAELCMVYVSDADGLCQFTLPPYAYEVHTLRLPGGYTGDMETVTLAPAAGGTLVLRLEKQ